MLGHFAAHLSAVRWLDDERFRSPCPLPGHPEGDYSILARQVNGRIQVACFGGLGHTSDQILSALGLTADDLRAQNGAAKGPKSHAEPFSAGEGPCGAGSNGKGPQTPAVDYATWRYHVGMEIKHVLDAIPEKDRPMVASFETERLVDQLVKEAHQVVDEQVAPFWPLPSELSQTDIDDELHKLAHHAISVFREVYLPAVAEPRQVSVYEDIQPALTALRVYEADEFFNETADLDNVEWLWEGIEPAVGIVGIFGDPEAGKSTFERTHSLCMSQGMPCLGRNCIQCKVLYLDLANERLSHRRAFTKLGWKRGNLKIVSHDSLIGLPNGLELVDNAIRDIGARMVVVDMMADLLRFKDLNDYADAKRALRGLRLLSQQTSTLINVLHHTPKALGPDADVLKAGLGSQAIVGAFDLRIAIRRRAKNLSTLVMSNGKLGGEPLTEEIVLNRDPETDWVTLGGTWAKHRSVYYVDQVVEFLKENGGERMGARRIAEELSLNAPWIRGSLALAAKNQQIQRTRIGRAYVYWHGEPDPVTPPPKEEKPRQLNLRRTTPRGDDPDDPDPNGISWSR